MGRPKAGEVRHVIRQCMHCGRDFTVEFARLAEGKGRYCSKPCYTAAQRAARKAGIEAHLLNHRRINPDTGCWEWTRSVDRDGYGHIKYLGRETKVSRLAMMLWRGFDLDDPRLVLHHCDNRRCFNPDHLYLGTPADNMRDRDARNPYRGERHARAKLTEAQAREIKRLIAQGMGNAAIARELGIAYHHVANIRYGRTWSWVEAAN